MKLLVILLILVSQAFATNEEAWPLECENDLHVETAPLTNILNSKFFSSSSKYYLYYEAKTLEDLQVLKNCLDYTACGKTKESITEDPKNNRVHIWANLTKKELTSLVRSCPIKDINKKLEVKEVDHQGKIVSLSGLTPSFFEQSQFIRSASPALFDEPSDKIIQATMTQLSQLLKTSKLDEAESLVLNTWGIDLHGYKIKYGGVADHVAVTTHKDKMINYGKDWLAEPCSYIRMVRHEAEHVAQFKRAKMCNLEHNYADHQMRERAAHLNDLRFLKTYCPGSAAIKYDCLERFRTKYMNLRKPPSK
jgi:hypothetical protein